MLRAMQSSGSRDSMTHAASRGVTPSCASDDAADNYQGEQRVSGFSPDTYCSGSGTVQMPPAGSYPAVEHAYTYAGPTMLAMGSGWPLAMHPGLPLDFADKVIDDFIMELGLTDSDLLESVGDISTLPPVVQLPSSYN